MTQCFIGDFRIQRPTHSADHLASVKWLAVAHAKSEAVIRAKASIISDSITSAEKFDVEVFQRSMERYITRFGCGPESLASRGHDLEDFLHTDWNRMRVFNLDSHPRGANMDIRMEVFAEIAERMLERFYPEGSEPPVEMIHVTCTGYVAPSAAQKLIVKRGWEQWTGIVHAYHMGCYASLPALRMASAFLASRRILNDSSEKPTDARANRIDIVHTETCTLHLDPSQHTPEQLVVQSLFADGHIRYSASHSEQGPGLYYLGVHEELIPGSLGAMGWILGERGMRMLLAREVPELIASSLANFLKRMFALANIDPTEAYASGLFAIHPGGPRIIDKVASLLQLQPHQVSASRAVLKAYGNMSSATLPHIWATIVDDATIPSGTLVTSLAFGPGLTVYGAILRKA
jgi:predicted naringenin-chalcone synthase